MRGQRPAQRRSVGALSGLAALFGALAWVLLAAGGNTALQADALSAAAGWQGEAWQGCGAGSGFAVCFGDDLIAHVTLSVL